MRCRSRPRLAVLLGFVAFVSTQSAFGTAVRSQLLPLADPVFIEKFDRLKRHSVFFVERTAETPSRILVLGSSRSEMGFDARRFSLQLNNNTVVFNFATPGGGPITNALYLRRILRQGAKPDRILLEIHPCLLCGEPEKNWLVGSRLLPSEFELLQRLGTTPHGTSHLGWRGWFTAVHAYRYSVLNRYAERWLPCPFGFTLGDRMDAFGFVTGVELSQHEREIALRKNLEQYAPQLMNFQPGGPALAALRDLISTCKTWGIPLVLFVSPEAKSFRDAYRPGSVELLNRMIKELDVPTIDCRDCVPDEQFADGHHMMSHGATLFTDKMVMEWRKFVQ